MNVKDLLAQAGNSKRKLLFVSVVFAITSAVSYLHFEKIVSIVLLSLRAVFPNGLEFGGDAKKLLVFVDQNNRPCTQVVVFFSKTGKKRPVSDDGEFVLETGFGGTGITVYLAEPHTLLFSTNISRGTAPHVITLPAHQH